MSIISSQSVTGKGKSGISDAAYVAADSIIEWLCGDIQGPFVALSSEVWDSITCFIDGNADFRYDLASRIDSAVTDLANFKAYIHRRLDEAGIPADPESPHKAEGCRIGGRLDIVLARNAASPKDPTAEVSQ